MLKTDYKDDVFLGNRKYQMTDNGDGTYSFDDVTEYVQVGDTYSASDINAQNQVINNLDQNGAIVVSNTVIPVESRDSGRLYFFYS